MWREDFIPTGPPIRIEARGEFTIEKWHDEGGFNMVFLKDEDKKLVHPALKVCVTTGKLPAGLGEKIKAMKPGDHAFELGGATISVRHGIVRVMDLGILVAVPPGTWPCEIVIEGEEIKIYPRDGAFITDAVPEL